MDISSDPVIELGEPIVVSQAPKGFVKWGPWQFPFIQRLPDGRLQVGFHVAEDAASAYGVEPGTAVSDDNGLSWRDSTVDERSVDGAVSKTLSLPNGDLLRQIQLKPRKLTDIQETLPPPLVTMTGSYGNTYHYYRSDQMPKELAGYRFVRKPKGRAQWHEETATVHVPGAVRGVAVTSGSEILVFPWIQRITPAPDGTIWGIGHFLRLVDGQLRIPLAVYFLHSTDNGHTWNLRGEIPFQPDKTRDKFWDKNDGFTEPNVAFLPDGSVFCLIRTLARQAGPLYQSRSTDNGKSWSKPAVFDDLGVWPALLTLKNGVTLAAYGRPGFYIRASRDPAGQAWGDKVTVVKPGKVCSETCSYSDLLALDENSALVVYSDFYYPDAQGHPRKTILVRRVTVK